MSDYISRDEALRVIMYDGCTAKNVESILRLPPADVAPVVRCKDCKGINYGVSRPEGRYLCERKSLWVFNNDFCSYGQKMDAEVE